MTRRMARIASNWTPASIPTMAGDEAPGAELCLRTKIQPLQNQNSREDDPIEDRDALLPRSQRDAISTRERRRLRRRTNCISIGALQRRSKGRRGLLTPSH